ncbi:unnamed protein product, partial [Choristocarpus tenellus]
GDQGGGEKNHGGRGKQYQGQNDEEQLNQLRTKVETMEADLSRRQESYIRRERAFNMRIEELEEEIATLKSGKTAWMHGDRNMQSIKNMHQQILYNVEMVQDRSSKILQEQEKDLLRAFRARLFDVQTELEREKARKDVGASAWIERTRQTEAELDWAKDMADRLDRVNQGLSRDNARLKSQFKSQEDDRNFLIRQLVAVKKESQSQRQEISALEERMTEAQEKYIRETEDMAITMRISNSPTSAQNRPLTSASAVSLPGVASNTGKGEGGRAT